MTVAELIAKLQELPQDARVVLENHYGGLDDTSEVDTAEIVVREHFPGGLGGTHGEWGRYMKMPPDETAVVIR